MIRVSGTASPDEDGGAETTPPDEGPTDEDTGTTNAVDDTAAGTGTAPAEDTGVASSTADTAR